MDAPPAHGSENLGNIWQGSSKPFCLQRLSLTNLFFTRSTDALAHEWSSLPLYAFPAGTFPQVLRRVREQWHKLILIAPLWRRQPWVSKLFQLTSSLKRTAGCGIHGPSYGPCMCGHSTGDFRPPRVCPKHYGRKLEPRPSEMGHFLDLVKRPALRPGHLRCVSGSFISAGDAG